MQGVETVLIYIISIIVLSVIFSEIRFRFFLRREKSRGRISSFIWLHMRKMREMWEKI